MVQRRAARWVLNRFNCKDSVTKMLLALKWKTLESRRTITCLSMLYKMRNRLVSHEDVQLQLAGHFHSTRSKEYSYTQLTATRDYFKYFFCSRTNTKWNQLPRETALSNLLAYNAYLLRQLHPQRKETLFSSECVRARARANTFALLRFLIAFGHV